MALDTEAEASFESEGKESNASWSFFTPPPASSVSASITAAWNHSTIVPLFSKLNNGEFFDKTKPP